MDCDRVGAGFRSTWVDISGAKGPLIGVTSKVTQRITYL